MAVRNADNILIGGYRVFVVDGDEKHELGWMSGEARVEEQGNTVTVKESEGGTVLTLTTDKEVHLTFGLLECNPETLIMLNPSAIEIGGTGDTESDGKGFAVGTFQSDKTLVSSRARFQEISLHYRLIRTTRVQSRLILSGRLTIRKTQHAISMKSSSVKPLKLREVGGNP